MSIDIGRDTGYRTVLEDLGFIYEGRNRDRFYRCLCRCGTEKTVRHQQIGRSSKSCGCLQKEISRERFTKHGCYKEGWYGSWNSMINRCNNKNCNDYKRYGEKGIEVCDRRLDLLNFKEDMGSSREKGLSIDRIDNSGNYCKENCRRATNKEQNRNRGNYNNIIEYNGERKTITEWAEEKGIGLSCLSMRLNKYGWSVDKSLNTPVERRKKL